VWDAKCVEPAHESGSQHLGALFLLMATAGAVFASSSSIHHGNLPNAGPLA
jgi:hypothetical protein